MNNVEIKWETYRIRVIENIGEESEKTFGCVGTEFEVRTNGYIDQFTDKNGFRWDLFDGFESYEKIFNKDFSHTIRTRFEVVK